MNHTGQPETILPDWRDGRIRELEQQLAEARAARKECASPDSREVATFLGDIVLDVAEIPDRTSPDDQPEIMLVTGEELKRIVGQRLIELCERSRSAD